MYCCRFCGALLDYGYTCADCRETYRDALTDVKYDQSRDREDN